MINSKIIATLGPASNTKSVLKKMFIKKLAIVRLNFSHGDHQEHIHKIKLIHNLNKELKRKVKIMQDLEGYRIRIGKLNQPIPLHKGMQFYLVQDEVMGNGKRISFSYKGPLDVIKKNAKIFLNDGRIVLKINEVEKDKIKAEVTNGGILKGNKGLNIPSAKIRFPSLTDKDKKDVRIAIQYKLDFIAQSFVRTTKDIIALQKIVKPKHPKCRIFAKIENKQAITNIDEIIDIADGIIIARGDLGICVPIHTVPVIQKKIIKKCHSKNKPVVVATQMLDSMTEEEVPTRAEVSDVSNAVLDNANYLLLSSETAVGTHPDKVIEMMDKIINTTQRYKRGDEK